MTHMERVNPETPKVEVPDFCLTCDSNVCDKINIWNELLERFRTAYVGEVDESWGVL